MAKGTHHLLTETHADGYYWRHLLSMAAWELAAMLIAVIHDLTRSVVDAGTICMDKLIVGVAN